MELGGGNGDLPPELPHHEWITCALDLSRLPPVGSTVIYFPQGHYEQWADRLEAAPAGHRPSMLCTVTSVHVVTAAHAPYAIVSLTPTPDAAPAPAVLVPRATRYLYNIKNYTFTDERASASLPKAIYATVLPILGHGISEQQLDMVDTKGRPWRFMHGKPGGGAGASSHFLKSDWRNFADANSARLNDKVFFLRDNDQRLVIELRNATDTERAAEQRLAAPPPDLAAELAQAAALSLQGQEFAVTYYPHKGVGKFVVLAQEVEESMEILWEAGMNVRLRKRKDVVEHTTQPLYTSQPAATGVVTAVMDSTWRGLEIKWDDETTTMTSAWEVEIISDPPRKKRRVDASGHQKED